MSESRNRKRKKRPESAARSLGVIRQNPTDELTDRERLFVFHLLASPELNQTEAARKAGFAEKSAGVHASKLLKRPRIQRLLARKRAERESKLELKAEDVLRYLHLGMTADWSKIFGVGSGDGTWVATKEQIADLAPEFGRLIEEISEVHITKSDGSELRMLKVRPISKAVCAKLAAKHQLPTCRIDITQSGNAGPPVNWSEMTTIPEERPSMAIEQRIVEVKATVVRKEPPPIETNGHLNGNGDDDDDDT